jgi:hypothetical protein
MDMSKWKERVETAELELPGGYVFLARRPSFREIASTGLVMMPSGGERESTEAPEPDISGPGESRRGFLLLDKVYEFMVRTALKPRIVVEVQDPETEVSDAQVAGLELAFFKVSLKRFFGIEVAEAQSFPADSSADAGRAGEAVREAAARDTEAGLRGPDSGRAGMGEGNEPATRVP